MEEFKETLEELNQLYEEETISQLNDGSTPMPSLDRFIDKIFEEYKEVFEQLS